MTKAELIERTIDRITDPWTESCEDYEYAQLIDLDGAEDVLKQCREEDLDLDEEDRLPADVTAEIMMEAFNCNVRKNKYELRIKRLAEFITDNEMVCEYANYYCPYHDDAIDLFPVDFLNSCDQPFTIINGKNVSPLYLIELGKRSRNFDSAEEYCWFDKDKNQLCSTNHPFRDGILDADAFAEFVISDEESLDYFINYIMDDDDVRNVFGCTKEELTHGN